MKRRYVDIEIFESRNMLRNGNIDFGYWHNTPPVERLHAAGVMIAAAFSEPDFYTKRMKKLFFQKENIVNNGYFQS